MSSSSTALRATTAWPTPATGRPSHKSFGLVRNPRLWSCSWRVKMWRSKRHCGLCTRQLRPKRVRRRLTNCIPSKWPWSSLRRKRKRYVRGSGGIVCQSSGVASLTHSTPTGSGASQGNGGSFGTGIPVARVGTLGELRTRAQSHHHQLGSSTAGTGPSSRRTLLCQTHTVRPSHPRALEGPCPAGSPRR